jgi:putative membrane protein
MPFRDLVPRAFLALYVVLFAWLAIDPFDRSVWWAENIPIIGIVVWLGILYIRGIRFSPLAYILMSVLVYLHTIGGHYTFERVPFDWFNHLVGFFCGNTVFMGEL